MSIHFISGKPGGGKSMYAVKLIVEELLYGDRCVITNVPLKLPELNEYLQKQYPAKSIDLHLRVRLFDEDEMKGFFTIRPEGSVGPKLLTKQEWEQGKRPDYTGITDKGVAYFVDEVHIGFNARSWMDTGRDVLYYLSQHRKLGDTVVCITQAIMNVDKQFRSVTQDYTYLRNLTKEKIGYFKLPSIFIRQTFNTPAGDNSKPMETGTFRLDTRGLAACYDTAKGVGIHGRAGADVKERKKGLPWYYAVALVIAFLYFMSQLAPRLIAKVFSPRLPENMKLSKSVETTNAPVAVRLFATTNAPRVEVVETNVLVEPSPVVSVQRLFGYWEVTLADGSVYRQGENAELTQISRAGVILSGKLHRYATPKPVELADTSSRNINLTPDYQIEPKPKRAKLIPGPNWQKSSQ